MNARNVWPAVVLAGGAMVVVAVMAIAGVDKDTIMLMISLLVVPVLGALLAGQLVENRAATQAVQQQTNGNQSRLLDILEAQGKLLAQSTAPAAAPDAGAGSP